MEIIGAEQEVERAIIVGGNPRFTGIGIDRGVGAVAADQIGAGEIRILIGEAANAAICADQGDVKGADFPIGLTRKAVIFDAVGRIEVGRAGQCQRVVAIDLAAERTHGIAGRAVDDIDNSAAVFIDLVVIGDQADLQRFRRREQQRAAQAPAIALVELRAAGEIGRIAVALVEVAGEAEGDGIADRPGHVTANDDGVEIAIGDFTRTAEFELRRARDDRDDTGRGILAEQGRLRAAQHFDALEIGQIADLGGRARAIDAVDEDTDRRLDAGVVGTVAKAANDEIGVGRALQLRDAQAGHQRLEVEKIANLGLFDLGTRGDGHRDRRVLQGGGALRGRDDDDGVIFGRGDGRCRCGGRGRRRCRLGLGSAGERDRREQRGAEMGRLGTHGNPSQGGKTGSRRGESTVATTNVSSRCRKTG